MTELPEYAPSKDEVKERLPLRYVCARLGVNLADDKALCPFHAEENPSFGVYVSERGVERWHCFPCGLDGDVFDLIQRIHGCTFPESIEYARLLLSELPENFRPEAQPQVEKVVDWEAHGRHLQDARLRAAQADHAGILAARVGYASFKEHALCARWDRYLRDTWGWGITSIGEILMPHWTQEGALVGCKVRAANGARESFKGSRYDGQLYGAWLGRRHQDVLVTEGETDCVFAGYQAREEQVPLDVFALPSGVNMPIEPEWLEFLKRSRTIYLALDPDDAGVRGTWRWLSALSEAGLKDVRICRLPLGRDLRDARPTIVSLLKTARKPVKQPMDIGADDEGYGRPGKEGEVRYVTDWTIEPIARLEGGDEPGYDVVVSHRGVQDRAVLRLSDLSSLRDMRRWGIRNGLIFTGRDDDVQRIADHVSWRGSVVPEIFQTDQVGLHEAPEDYAFTGPSVVFSTGYLGKTPWRYIPSAKTADVSGKLLLPTRGSFDWSWLEDFLSLSDPSVMQPLLAWAVASARRAETSQFPLLFIGGSSGVGKSTLARLVLQLVGSQIEVDLGAVTPFILVKTLASSTTLPVFIDEWTRLSRRDARETFQGAIPVLYAGGNAERGQADLSSTVYRLTAPVLVAGEDTFMLDRELERMVTVSPSRAAQRHDVLARILDKPLERFGQLLHTWLTTEPELPTLELREPTRVAYNRQVLEVGWQTLRLLLEEASRYDDVPEISVRPDLSALDNVFELDDENVYDQALLIGASMQDTDRHPVVWRDPGSRGTWARFQVLTGLLQSRNVDLQLPGGSRSMKSYFEEHYGKLELGASVTPPGSFTSLRAWLIPGHQLPEGDPRSTWVPE